MWSTTNGSGNFRIISESGMISGASRCNTTCQPRPFDAVDDAVEHGHVGRAAKMLDEIEARAAHAAAIEPVVVLVGETVVDDGDAAIALRVGRNAVEHRRVVGAMAARLHDHGALDAEMGVQRAPAFPSAHRPACSAGSRA